MHVCVYNYRNMSVHVKTTSISTYCRSHYVKSGSNSRGHFSKLRKDDPVTSPTSKLTEAPGKLTPK